MMGDGLILRDPALRNRGARFRSGLHFFFEPLGFDVLELLIKQGLKGSKNPGLKFQHCDL
jgi:hypothetical protein